MRPKGQAGSGVADGGRRAGSALRRARSALGSRAVSLASLALGLVPAAVQAQQSLPYPTGQGQTQVGRTVAQSAAPQWPADRVAPAGAPNILLILTDDVGFGASSTFGGPIPTPTFEALSREGLRYNRFNTTALCSPTRAALLTGRNAQNVNMGDVTNLAAGYEGYTTVIPNSAATIAEILKDNGYNTAMFGKSHLTPEWEMSEAGPFDRWPTGLGFEYFYGFLSADTDQWAPSIVENTTQIEPPHDDSTYIFERDMADKAIAWIGQQHAIAPNKPFFVYYATGATHTPHHAPKEWIAKFRGKFDQGWDKQREETFQRQKALGIIPADAKLTPRPSVLPAWDSLSADQKRVYTRLMEAYAGQLAFTDAQIGRIIDNLKQTGQLANTMVVFIQGDNGASAEGGPNGLLYEQSTITGGHEDLKNMLAHLDDIGGPTLYNHYPAAWAWAMNAPFPYWKQVASQAGGVRNGLVISWPGHTDKGAVRSQYSYVTDIFPTLLDAAHVPTPSSVKGIKQMPLDGISLTYSFTHPEAPSQRHVQIYEMMQNFGIYQDGWMAGVLPKAPAWEAGAGGNRRMDVTPDQRTWQLFHIDTDFSTADDLAKTNPAKLQQMQALFWQEAARNHILPIHDYTEGTAGRPSLSAGRNVFTYTTRISRVVESAAPPTIGRSFQIDADITVPTGGGQGVLITQGGRFGGYAFYLKDGRPVFHYNAVGHDQFTVRAPAPVTPGNHQVTADFRADTSKPGTPGTLTLSVDGKAVATGRIGRTIAGWMSHTEGLDIGHDTITPVNDDYAVASSRFNGDLQRVTVTITR